MAKICLCLAGKTIARDLELIEKYRGYIDIAELRVDFLMEDEFAHVRRFPELAGIPVILTARRKSDGGNFKGTESSRVIVLSRALAFAHPDARHNFAYIDIEEDLDIPSLEEVARAFNTRIIRSFHNFNSVDDNLYERIQSLYHVGDEIAKAALFPKSCNDVARIFEVSKKLAGKDKILLGMGDIGHCTRILAAQLGTYLTYTSPLSETDVAIAAPGQIDPVELSELYHFNRINASTKVYGICGYPLQSTNSPLFYNKIFNMKKTNDVYIRFPSATIESFLYLADTIPITAASITVPHKTEVLKYLYSKSEEVKKVGACNTIVRKRMADTTLNFDGWAGYNTDTYGFERALLNLTGKENLKGRRCTVIGAGGASRAVCCVISRLKGKALILNRDVEKAKKIAELYGFEYAYLNESSFMKMNEVAPLVSRDEVTLRRLILDFLRSFKKGKSKTHPAVKYSDIIIQTSSVGALPDVNADPIPWYQFSGKEYVIDIIYKPSITKLLQRALNAGCKAINGDAMLLHQAREQYKYFFNAECPVE